MSPATDVLLVEDDRNHIEVALRALRQTSLPASIQVARDGLEALRILGLEEDGDHAPAPLPRVVFLDIKMPRVDGWEVLRRLRKDPRTAHLPVVVLSGSDRPEDVERSYELGANSFVVKGFDGPGPGSYFAEAVHYWYGLNRSPRDRGAFRKEAGR